jgi:DNA-binding response OmpR family regulator
LPPQNPQRESNDNPGAPTPIYGRVDSGHRQPSRQTMVAHDLDGLLVQSNDSFRMLLIDDYLVRFSQLEYLVLLQLLNHYMRCVSSSTLLRETYGCSDEPGEARRLAKIIYRLRPKLALHGLVIYTVIGTSHRPWGYMLQRTPPGTPANSSSAHSSTQLPNSC